jgi:WD40 repeat protein
MGRFVCSELLCGGPRSLGCTAAAPPSAESLALLPPSQNAVVVSTLPGHTARVNCVAWLGPRDGSDEAELVSCSSDGVVIVWAQGEVCVRTPRRAAVRVKAVAAGALDAGVCAVLLPCGYQGRGWHLGSRLATESPASVTAVSGLRRSGSGGAVLVATSTQGAVHVWTRCGEWVFAPATTVIVWPHPASPAAAWWLPPLADGEALQKTTPQTNGVAPGQPSHRVACTVP